MELISAKYTLKAGSLKESTEYLGKEVWKFTLPDNLTKTRWAMSSNLYVKHAVTNVECELSNTDQALKTCVSTPTAPGY